MKAKNTSQIINYLILIVVAVCLGILSRIYGTILPEDTGNYAGDAMWAFALYYLIALFSLKRSFSFRFFWTCLILALDELTQLYHATWIDEIRNTTIGAFVLGNTFDLTDLLSYFVGALLAVVVDYTFVKTR